LVSGIEQRHLDDRECLEQPYPAVDIRLMFHTERHDHQGGVTWEVPREASTHAVQVASRKVRELPHPCAAAAVGSGGPLNP
jgi:hypothetical protein